MENGSLVAARFASYLLLLTLAGLPFHALIERHDRFGRKARILFAILTLAALLVSLWWALANVAAMADVPLAELDRKTFTAVIGATPLGTLLTVRTAALGLFLVAVALYPRPRLLAPLALVALASAAWAGHAGAGEAVAGDMLRASDVLHLAAAALWLGAMLTFFADIACNGRQSDVVRSLSAFARTGTLVVIVLFVTGLANTWLISGESLPAGLWPGFIFLKAALFVAMLGLAAINRWRLVPALESGVSGASTRLKRSLMLEASCAIAIVVVIAFAGQTNPHGG